MPTLSNVNSITASFSWRSHEIHCGGAWTLHTIDYLNQQIAAFHPSKKTTTLSIHGAELTHLDTAGAWLLEKFLKQLTKRHLNYKLVGFTDKHTQLLNLLGQQRAERTKTETDKKFNLLTSIGKQTVSALIESLSFLAFIGEITIHALNWVRKPRNIQWKLFFNIIENTGYRALPIIGLLSFLIGVVLTYQMGLQLRNYGANIFIVNLVGLAMLREFAPLITAIIIAGRSGSAFAAQIGTMQINDEINALLTMGISPIERLVLQRLFGLMIALPLLTVWSDITGVLGGMFMSKNMLNIEYVDFIQRFKTVIPLKTYFIGLSKTPVFAILIATVGCFQGFQVKGSAGSVGQQTTISVVRSIFLIICADALFSVLFSWYGI